jgi:hypothetical protein
VPVEATRFCQPLLLLEGSNAVLHALDVESILADRSAYGMQSVPRTHQ